MLSPLPLLHSAGGTLLPLVPLQHLLPPSPVARRQGPKERVIPVPLQGVSFAESTTPIAVSPSWRLYVGVRVDPACASDVNSITGLTTWAAAIHLSRAGISCTLYSDDLWEVNVDEGPVWYRAPVWTDAVTHDGHVPDGAVWLTHVPHATTNTSTWSYLRYVLLDSVCDGLPSAAEVAAADAAAAAEAAARAQTAQRQGGGG